MGRMISFCIAIFFVLTLAIQANAQNWFQDLNRQSMWFHENAKQVLEGKQPNIPGPDVLNAPGLSPPQQQQYALIVNRMQPSTCSAIANSPNSNAWGAATYPTAQAAQVVALQNCQNRTNSPCILRSTFCK
jgi:hypothetical protein